MNSRPQEALARAQALTFEPAAVPPTSRALAAAAAAGANEPYEGARYPTDLASLDPSLPSAARPIRKQVPRARVCETGGEVRSQAGAAWKRVFEKVGWWCEACLG